VLQRKKEEEGIKGNDDEERQSSGEGSKGRHPNFRHIV
jgi:hypothetical protein